jgi:thiamine kinase-like enzyme
MTESIDAVLAQIPGWQDASAVRLSGGRNNHTWLIEVAGRKAVLKVDKSPRGEPFNSRSGEAQIQSRAANAGLANKVLHVTETIYVTEYASGVVWSAGSLDDDVNLDKLAAALKRLHALPLTGRVFDARGAARTYVGQIDGNAAMVRDCLARIDAMPLPQNLCCCHNDLVAANIICVPEVRFLDWEYACDNDPFFDLATIVAHHRLSAERANYLLDAYFDGDGARWRCQLQRQAEFYDALLWLWEASRSGTR